MDTKYRLETADGKEVSQHFSTDGAHKKAQKTHRFVCDAGESATFHTSMVKASMGNKDPERLVMVRIGGAA